MSKFLKIKPEDIRADYEYKVIPLNSKGEEVKVKSTYYSRNKEKCKKYNREYAKRTVEQRKVWQKGYYATHVEQQKLKHKLWFQKSYVSKIRLRTIDELMDFSETLSNDTRIEGIENPTGKQWVQWFLKYYKKEKNGKH